MNRSIRNAIHGAILSVLAAAFALPAQAGRYPDLSRETLPANDGWASLPTEAFPLGTTGGSAASAERVHVVSDRNALVAALAYPDPTPKIIQVTGVIDANVDDDNQPLRCDDYVRADPDTGELYSLEQYLTAYDPATWGREDEPSGPQERARDASADAQTARIRIRIPPNTTIVGATRNATIRGAWFDIRPGSGSNNAPANVIIRNLTFVDTHDCFPAWDPADGSEGNWNSLYDAISVRNATHVWLDHNAFLDVETADAGLPTYFGRLYQIHDGLVDITNASDLVTVSWNLFANHDKAMLIGSSDSASADRNRLRVTLHHNLLHDLGQRAPRVRFGQVHVYNNLYSISSTGAEHYAYSWGVGAESQMVAQNNQFLASHGVTSDLFIGGFKGTQLLAEGNAHNLRAFDPVVAYNAVNDTDIENGASWAPVLYRRMDPAWLLPLTVTWAAGPLR
ncbi:pectate lyase [Luteimonas cucumeris]|uniref:Pectate lyase n=1 Tax=Luteimonas cucumeris TaxID=985012 RepID=A0A562LEA9_9GAMM|nr:pectate lyase [Luteimonas cucumeris]TWI05784.1 pectate lyase [Luteimonas cucumeris]